MEKKQNSDAIIFTANDLKKFVETVDVATPAHHLKESSGDIPPLDILILIVGSRGDVQPFIAFGQGLQKMGHRVRLATHINFKKFVSDEGLEFFPLKGEPEYLMSFMVEHPDMITFDPVEITRKQKMMEDIYESTWDACTKGGKRKKYRPDVLISNPPVHVHVHLHHKLQIPLHIMFTMPWSPTADYMHPLAPMQGALTNRQSYSVVDNMVWIGLGPQMQKFRTNTLKLAAISGGADLAIRLEVPHIYCMSQYLVPKPKDWGPHIDVVGFWFLDSKVTYNPPKDLVDFINAGPKPIYIGFGSIVVADPKKLGQDVIEAIKLSGQRAIVGSGWAKIGEGMDLPDTIKLVGAVPHEWLFQYCSAVCHHGGAGTTAAGLKAGLPTIIVPFFGDQPFWGSCVAKMGVGPEPIPAKNLTKEKLAEAIRFCTKEEVKAAAAALGKKIDSEDGVTNAVQAFHRKLPVYNGLWQEEIWENEWYSFGWHHTHLAFTRPRYSDRTGALELRHETFVLPEGWEWTSEWTPVSNENTDKEGWMYAHSFSSGNWKPKGEMLDLARTRQLIRYRKYVGGPKTHLKVSASDILNWGLEFMLFVTAHEGKGLAIKDMSGKSDPYLVLEVKTDDKLKKQKQRTKSVNQSLDPIWNQTLWFEVNPDSVIKVECWDYDMISKDDTMGSFEFSVRQLLEKDAKEKLFTLSGSGAKGTIHLLFDW